MRQVPLQVLSERSAEAQAAGQSHAEQPYVAVCVTADLKQVYSALQVGSCVLLAVLGILCTLGKVSCLEVLLCHGYAWC